jgi:uncharacterized protein DUF3303
VASQHYCPASAPEGCRAARRRENHPEKIRGWYNLAGGGAGFMLIETENPRELTEILQPYMDLVSWDVHSIYELSYDTIIEEFRKSL